VTSFVPRALRAESGGADLDVEGVVVGVRLDRELVAVLEGDQEEVRELLEHEARATIAAARALIEVAGGRRGDGLQLLDLGPGEREEREPAHAAAPRDPGPQHGRPLPDRVRMAAEMGRGLLEVRWSCRRDHNGMDPPVTSNTVSTVAVRVQGSLTE